MTSRMLEWDGFTEDDLWHGGEGYLPAYHPDCDVEPGPDSREWVAEPESRG